MAKFTVTRDGHLEKKKTYIVVFTWFFALLCSAYEASSWEHHLTTTTQHLHQTQHTTQNHTMSDTYVNTVAGVTGFLGLKLAVTHLLTIRTRLLTTSFKTAEDSTDIPAPLVALFKVLLGAYGPPQDMARLQGCVSNSLENEPQLLAMALMLGLSGKANDTDVLLLKVFAAMRFIHFVTYLLAVQPFRALSFVSGLTVNLFFGARLTALLL